MTSDIDESIDWQGKEINCESCAHLALSAKDRCRLKHACVHDRYARRIDRFFDWNPSLANGYIDHPHFEVRAIAAKSADVFRLPALLADPDETVRWNAARRLPRRYLLQLRNDAHREVRIRVASLLDETDLFPMMQDTDYYVRLVVARRIPMADLPAMMADEEAEVRRVVASRIDREALAEMAGDKDAEVRLAVVRRLTPVELIGFHRDSDWRVRYEAASRVPPGILAEMADDPDDMVRDLVRTRIEQQGGSDLGSNVVRLERRTQGNLSQPARRRRDDEYQPR
ncbi:MAG: LRV FeS4 cluster domain-containing protein [Chitinivibrionia bacterium]|nr:LRV FeS4 cluster domain-containing protein [Chitinivibrionia bacterium]